MIKTLLRFVQFSFSVIIATACTNICVGDVVLDGALGPLQNSPISDQANDFDMGLVCFEVLAGSDFEGLSQLFLEVGINEPGSGEEISFDVEVVVYDGDPGDPNAPSFPLSNVVDQTAGPVSFPDFNLNGPTSGQTDYTIPVNLGDAGPLLAGYHVCASVTTTLNGGPGQNPDVWGIAPTSAAVPEPSAFLMVGLVGILCCRRRSNRILAELQTHG